MVMNLIEVLVNSPFTPHEEVIVTRKVPITKENGAETTITENIGTFTVFISPPDTLNKNDGAILERLMIGAKTNKAYMMYGLCEGIKDGDTVFRPQTDNLYYEVKIEGHHGEAFNNTAIRHHKCYIVLKGNQKQ